MIDVRKVGFLFLLPVIAACSDIPSRTTGPQLKASAAERLDLGARSPSKGRTIREEFRDLSADVPGFTGIYFDDDGALTISASRELAAEQRSKAVAWAAGYSNSVSHGAPARTKLVKFDYATLYDALGRLTSRIARTPGLVSTHIDEKRGQIVLGVDDSQARGVIRAEARALNLPSDILRIEDDQATRPDSTIRDPIRYLVGGLQIANPYPWTDHCTLGHIVWMKGEDGWPNYNLGFALYSSHCTVSRYSVDRKPAYGQPSLAFPVAQEWEEAPVYTCAHGECQDADVAVLAIMNGVTFGVATVAMSSQPSDTSVPPPFLGRQSTSNLVLGALTGETVTKVGRTTGQTSGTIIESCVDRQVANTQLFIMCSQRATYFARRGDSGSPVFIKSGEPGHSYTPRPAGLHWGSVVQDGAVISSFSPASQIDNGFGGRYQWYP